MEVGCLGAAEVSSSHGEVKTSAHLGEGLAMPTLPPQPATASGSPSRGMGMGLPSLSMAT